MPLNDCEINLILAWSNDCVISSAVGAVKFKIAYTKLYVPVVKLLQQLKSVFKKAFNWKKINQKYPKKCQTSI